MLLKSLNLKIIALTLLAYSSLSTLTLYKLFIQSKFQLIIAFSLLLIIMPLIKPFKKLNIIMSKVISLALAIALNIAFKALCSCYALLVFILLNVSAKASLKSFLTLMIKPSPLSLLLIAQTTSAVVFNLSFSSS